MVSAGDFRNGITIELEGNIYQIIEFQHVKPGNKIKKYQKWWNRREDFPSNRKMPTGKN